MHTRSYSKRHMFSLIIGASGLLALLAGCPISDLTLPGINQDPTADAGTDITIDVGQRVALNGLGSTDADDDPLTFSWQQRSGPPVMLDSANSPQPNFVPSTDGFYEFALTVTDGRGGSDTSVVRVFVGDVDPATCPRADAGTDQTLNEGAAVRLRGGNSADPAGGPLTFDWFQVSGPQVSISGVFIAEPSFAAPQTTGADIKLEFELTVSNEQGCPDRDTVVITVRDRASGDPCDGVVCNDDGLFCSGIESCVSGTCVSNGDPCSANQTCDEQRDACATAPCDTDADCDDGRFCNGAETCVAGECQDGTPPCTENATCASIEDGLIAKWNLDGDAVDATGNGHDGVVSGALATADRLGNPRGAMSFGGSTYLSVPDDPEFTLGTAEFTIAAWVTRTAFGADGGCYLLGHSDGPGDRSKWIFWLGSNGISFVATHPGGHWVGVGTYAFSPDEWNQVAIRRQGDTLTAFVDGSPIGSVPFSRSIPDPSQPLTIGTAEFDRAVRSLQGALDEVRFYNRALSDAELQTLVAEGDDGIPLCSRAQICNEDTDSCTMSMCTTDADCDDGLYCSGLEICVNGSCQPGAAPCSASEFCAEGTDECAPIDTGSDTIRSSEWLTGAIDPVVDQDTYTFIGQAGQHVIIQANTTSGGLSPWIDLFPPSGGAREANSNTCRGCTIALLGHDLAESGQYTIVVRDREADSTGEYIISLLVLSGPLTSPQDQDGGTIAFDEVKTASIDPVVDMDAYTFTGQAGQRVTIQANTTSGGLSPWIDLFPPGSGSSETNSNTCRGCTIAQLFAHPLAQSGQYTILIRDREADSTGEYLLSLSVLP